MNTVLHSKYSKKYKISSHNNLHPKFSKMGFLPTKIAIIHPIFQRNSAASNKSGRFPAGFPFIIFQLPSAEKYKKTVKNYLTVISIFWTVW
jgi:hypothetical protein